ncbi:putative rRNA-processing protein EFG1 [Elsinoe fawcettii]|nr:putative rRNA-processing protein EFG1 [Elsinoe fawcettii]
MGTKRPRSDDAPPPSSKKHKPSPAPSSHRAGKPSKSFPKHKKPNPLGPLKSRIRSLRRLLAHDDALDAPGGRAHRPKPYDLTQEGLHPDREAILHSKDELDIAAKHERRDEKRVKRLPAGVRLERERELKGLEGRVEEEERRRKRGEMIGRWHMVRFFERRRGERRVRRLRKEVKRLEEQAAEEAEDGKEGGGKGDKEVEELRQRVHRAEVDLNYALYWPLERAYVSLWPRKGKEGEEDSKDEEGRGDREMWALVERCMKEGTLEDLREGRVEGCGVERPESKQKVVDGKDKSGNGKGDRNSRRGEVQAEAEDESDDGFFE